MLPMCAEQGCLDTLRYLLTQPGVNMQKDGYGPLDLLLSSALLLACLMLPSCMGSPPLGHGARDALMHLHAACGTQAAC